jgi:hypothetical protein
MELEKLDEMRHAHVAGANESVIIWNAEKNKIVVVIIWQFCENNEVLKWLNGIIDEDVGLWRGIRVSWSIKPVYYY